MSARLRIAGQQRFLAVLVLLVVVFVFFAVTQDRFFSSANITTLITSALAWTPRWR